MASENGKQETSSTIKVKITKKYNVKPKKNIGKKECQLITFDLPYLGFFYNQKLLIYKGNGSDYEEMVGKLKDGLSRVLEEFYQLGGKLGRDDDGVFKVMYDDDMDGVEVLEAILDHDGNNDDGDNHDSMVANVDELASKEISFMKDLIPYNGILNLEGLHLPLLAIQLTKLRDGLAMGCAFNHAVLDGTSTWHFMSSWADICCGAPSISLPPFLDRTKARSTRVSLNIPDAPPQPESTTPTPLREKLFRFPETAIEKIKAALNSGKGDSIPFSTFQSLSTHIWRAITSARGLKPEEPTVFTIFVDCRKRVSPPMPDSYFGNLIQAVFTGTASGMVTGNPPEFAAGMIQAAIKAHDAAAIENRNKEFEGSPIIFQFKDAGMNCVAVGSSPRFKVYDVDFGFGKPEWVRSGTNNRFDGMVYLYPGKDGGKSIDVEISLEARAMEVLEKDNKFLLDGEVI
ncbi:hypothetical protein RND81_05G090800 [Saponaria officinalis]|uniref:anthranilate N-benzoyltransferase n=1 Tax=Saponaria officinalis TaxID=3572 RepID=A0AAW1KRG4_SAPOF